MKSRHNIELYEKELDFQKQIQEKEADFRKLMRKLKSKYDTKLQDYGELS